jgi:hypothetical protein
MSETDIQRRIQLALSTEHSRIWRNSVGEAWLGRDFTIAEGKLVRGKAYRITYGLGPGSSDLVGPVSIEITPAMVGCRVAVFAGIEIKRPGDRAAKKRRGRTSEAQGSFIETLTGLGGIGGVATSVEEAIQIVTSFTPRRC